MLISLPISKNRNPRYFTIQNIFLFSILLLIIEADITISGQEKKPLNVRAQVSGMLDCINSSVRLTGSSDDKNMTYRWDGPNGYLATAKECTTSIPGNYTLIATEPKTGETYTSSVIVNFDTVAPTGISAEVSGVINCMNTIVTLQGNSSTKGVKYSWEGPQGFSSEEKQLMTSIPGFYKLIVTNPSNGCSSTISAQVQKNIEKPRDVEAFASGTLTCKKTSATLKGTSSTEKVTYEWSGPGFTANTARVEVVMPGEYRVMVTNPVNGCSSEAKVTVKQDTNPPKNVVLSAPDTLNCKRSVVNVKATSGVDAATYEWEGPDNFTSNAESFETYIPGEYTVTITDPENGCSAKRNLYVMQDTIPPHDVTLISSGILTCKTESVTLSGKSNISCLIYDWSGPDNFISGSPNPEVNDPGRYQARITNTRNGCLTTQSITVTQDTVTPSIESVKVSDTLNCSVKKVKLTGLSNAKDVIYSWTGPKDYSGTGQAITTSYPGTYILTVINPTNGCVSRVSRDVIEKECAE